MNNFLDDLKLYFKNTPRNKVLEDWAKTESFDQVGISMDDFLSQTYLEYNINTEIPLIECNVLIHGYSPEFSSGFFLKQKTTSNHAKSSIFNCQLSV